MNGDIPMPLLDHFHPPLLGHRHWEGFYGWWATALADSLNKSFPPEYFTEFRAKLGTRVEVEVGAFTQDEVPELPPTSPRPSRSSRTVFFTDCVQPLIVR